jgi:hypothetical protein
MASATTIPTRWTMSSRRSGTVSLMDLEWGGG